MKWICASRKYIWHKIDFSKNEGFFEKIKIFWFFIGATESTSYCHKETHKPYSLTLNTKPICYNLNCIEPKYRPQGWHIWFDLGHVYWKSKLKKFFKFFLNIVSGQGFESTLKTAFQALKRRFKATFGNYLPFLAIFVIV